MCPRALDKQCVCRRKYVLQQFLKADELISLPLPYPSASTSTLSSSSSSDEKRKLEKNKSHKSQSRNNAFYSWMKSESRSSKKCNATVMNFSNILLTYATTELMFS